MEITIFIKIDINDKEYSLCNVFKGDLRKMTFNKFDALVFEEYGCRLVKCTIQENIYCTLKMAPSPKDKLENDEVFIYEIKKGWNASFVISVHKGNIKDCDSNVHHLGGPVYYILPK